MVGMRKDPRVGGGVGGTSAIIKNSTQHSPRVEFGSLQSYLRFWAFLVETVRSLDKESRLKRSQSNF
ncbi:hypothetical protein Lal_00011399 [Lupinus albus]|nr:hypothetical protein Lal_00011399 [Lupinus albus]